MQLKLDFTGKKTERITFAATEELKDTLEKLCKRLGFESISELVQEYVIENAFRDMGKLQILEHRSTRKIIDMI